MTDKFDCVVNHYRQQTHPEKVRTSAMLSASCLRAEPEVENIFLVDGSPAADDWLSDWCVENGVIYIHQGRSLSFAEGYNVGLARCTSKWTVLTASDIYVPTHFFREAIGSLASIPAQDLGCAVPYLTFCDLPTQKGYPRIRRPQRSPLMSLNFNVFETSLLREIGGVSERYSGCYNDVDLILRMRAVNRHVYLLPILVLHYGRMTTGAGSNVSYEKDDALFRAEHPNLVLDGAVFGLRLRTFFSSKLARLLLWPEAFFPKKYLTRIQLRVLKLNLY